MRYRVRLAALLATFLAMAGLLSPAASAEPRTQSKQLLAEGSGAYPRLIRLQHSSVPGRDGRILASVTGADGWGNFARIFESTDEGQSFHPISEIRDEAGRLGMCCGTLYELPQRVGRLRAGTVLWAATYRQNAGPDRRTGIRIWASQDGGHNWRFLSEAVRSHNHDAIWEPEFTVDAGGTLWLHYADETHAPEHAQVLGRIASSDGVNWGSKQVTLALPPDSVRPGMPIIRRLPDGRYYLAYEICNYGERYCNPYFKISQDGANWGDPHDPGTQVSTASGNHFQHAQTIALAPGGPNGTRILMVGQIYVDAKGTPLPGNGRTLLANDNFGSGPWYEVPAPVHIADPSNNWCPNYSSALLAANGGQSVVEIATEFNDAGTCQAYFGVGPAS